MAKKKGEGDHHQRGNQGGISGRTLTPGAEDPGVDIGPDQVGHPHDQRIEHQQLIPPEIRGKGKVQVPGRKSREPPFPKHSGPKHQKEGGQEAPSKKEDLPGIGSDDGELPTPERVEDED